MNRKPNIKWILGWVICMVSLSLANDKMKNEITWVIDGTDSLKIPVHQALLYRRVEMGYDSTLIIQSGVFQKTQLYPQLKSGNKIILRMIAGTINTVNPNFYDVFLVIGDTIPDRVLWEDEQERVYIGFNGKLMSDTPQSKNIHGEMNFLREKRGDISSVKLNLKFEYPFKPGRSEYHQVALKGEFSLRVGDYRELTVGESQQELEKKKKKRQNLYIAVVLSVFLIAVFGLR